MPKKKTSKKPDAAKAPVKSASILRHVTGTSDFDERRKSARLDIPLKVEYRLQTTDHRPQTTDQRPETAVTKNVSVGGCLLLLKEELPIDSTIEIKLFLGEKENEALILSGRIVRLNREEDNLHEYGIAFNEISSEARRLFADFCFAKMYEMIGLVNWPSASRQEVGSKK